MAGRVRRRVGDGEDWGNLLWSSGRPGDEGAKAAYLGRRSRVSGRAQAAEKEFGSERRSRDLFAARNRRGVRALVVSLERDKIDSQKLPRSDSGAGLAPLS